MPNERKQQLASLRGASTRGDTPSAGDQLQVGRRKVNLHPSTKSERPRIAAVCETPKSSVTDMMPGVWMLEPMYCAQSSLTGLEAKLEQTHHRRSEEA